MRPNYAFDPPPAEISVGGTSYPANTDYRTWLEAHRILSHLRTRADTESAKEELIRQLVELENLVFGGWLKDESPVDVLRALTDFLGGYPSAPSPYGESSAKAPTFSFEYDLNLIILAIRTQYGIDLSYRRTEPLHWWEFLLLFQGLSGDHAICRLMEARGYDGKDKDLLKRKRACALPEEMTPEEIEELEEFNRLLTPPDEEN